MGRRYSVGGGNYIAHPPAIRVDDSGPQNLKNPRSHFVVVRYCRFGWVPGSAGLGDFPARKRSRLAEEAVLCRVLLRDDAGMTGDFDGI